MVEKYHVRKNRGNGNWHLTNRITNESSTHDSFDAILNIIKADTGEFFVIDSEVNGVAYYKKGKVVSIETETGWEQDEEYMSEHYPLSYGN